MSQQVKGRAQGAARTQRGSCWWTGDALSSKDGAALADGWLPQVCVGCGSGHMGTGIMLPWKCSLLRSEQRGTFFLGFHGPSICSTSLRHYVEPSQDYNEGQDLFGLRWNLPRIRERQISTSDPTGHCSCGKCAEVECSHAGGFCTTTHVAQKSDFSSDCRLSAPTAISQSSSQLTSPLQLGHHTRPFQCPLLGAL